MSTANFMGTSLRITGVYGPAGKAAAINGKICSKTILDGKPITPRIATEIHGEDVARGRVTRTRGPAGSCHGPGD